ncbi:MAG: xylan 1,4-beta-xylosidase [Prevotella sp.]|nr:glycoside hydrolase family 3 C-terminal domain-containing protein [Prevotellaceae bacterium]MDY5343317.1 xylan 1,4-beta-xylosidase [Prevotella sp.]
MKKQLITTLMALFTMGAGAQNMLPYQNPNLSPEERADDLIGRLTIEEKTALMMDQSPAIERLGIPSFQWWNEALHGVGRNGYTTVFPITMGMAASWDDALLYRCFDAVSDEARIKNAQAKSKNEMNRYQGLSFWTPNINIFRDPRWGRGQETYGEDPFLTSRMGVAVVNGLQGNINNIDSKYMKLLACAKHYAVHSGPEWNRHSFNIEDLPERDLWETYLPAFKALVEKANVAEVMCAYQRIDGDPCCGNKRYLQRILRDDWGYQGLVVSDCGAISDFFQKGCHEVSATPSIAAGTAIIAGTDVECGSVYKNIPKALENGELTMDAINKSLKRLLTARIKLGDLDNDNLVEWTKIPHDRLCSKQHNALAYEMAQKSIVLLQNSNNILPLKKNGGKIVVMGPNANDSVMQWGNYSGYPLHTVTILEGIEKKLRGQGSVKYVDGCGHVSNTVRESRFANLTTPDGKAGMEACYWNNTKMEGKQAATAIYKNAINLNNGGNTAFDAGVELDNFSGQYKALFKAQRDEEVTFELEADDGYRIIINGDTIRNRFGQAHGVQKWSKTYNVKAGEKYDIQIDYIQIFGMAHLKFDVFTNKSKSIGDILKEISDAEYVVFAGGISPRLEGEEMKVDAYGFKGGDRTDIQLPQCQRDLIKAISDAGKKVIFVNCSGSAIALVPETSTCQAIMQAWYPGERGGDAVADVLFGDYNPSGKLPVTFYRSVDDLPDFLDYTMKNRTYRYFTGKPLWNFGYGLSYTSFSFGKPSYKNGKISVEVSNTGKLDGDEVVQVYLRHTKDNDGPIKSLRGFKRVSIKAGETKRVEIDMPKENFETWDASTNTMRVIGGEYDIMVGNSSIDADLKHIKIVL